MADLFSEEALYKKSPQELTTLLYDALLNNLEMAMDDIGNRNLISANKRLQKANDILQRLGAGLNYEAGIVADQLDVLYNYMANQLIKANIRKDVSIIKEVVQIVTTIFETWNEAMKAQPNQRSNNTRTKVMAYEKNVLIGE